MGTFKMKYLVCKRKGGKLLYYWQPKKLFVVGGKLIPCPFKPVRLARDSGKVADAIKEAEKLNGHLEAWRNGLEAAKRIQIGTVDWLIANYVKDRCFTNLRATTQRTYRGDLKEISSKLGDVPLQCLSRSDARAVCNDYAENPRKPSAIASMGRILYNFGKEIEAVTANPFENLRISKAAPRQAVWPMETIEAVQKKAVEIGLPSISLAVQLALDTGQRSTDIRLLTWNRYEGGRLKFRQSKTSVWVEVRVMKSLAAMLERVDRKAPALLICEGTGKPYTKDEFSRKFRDVCEAAGVGADLQFRDLRRTAVVRLAEHGCDIAEICAITGHKLTSATEILEVYLPRNRKMADNAIDKLENKK